MNAPKQPSIRSTRVRVWRLEARVRLAGRHVPVAHGRDVEVERAGLREHRPGGSQSPASSCAPEFVHRPAEIELHFGSSPIQLEVGVSGRHSASVM